jgi:hypothetical protein
LILSLSQLDARAAVSRLGHERVNASYVLRRWREQGVDRPRLLIYVGGLRHQVCDKQQRRFEGIGQHIARAPAVCVCYGVVARGEREQLASRAPQRLLGGGALCKRALRRAGQAIADADAE